MSVLTLRALSKRYGRIQAVDGVNLTSGEGELLAILGPSGSGKSTIMRLVAGLEMPTSGDILIDGKSVLGIPPKDRNVAMVFQSFALYPHMSVRDNILFPLVARKVPKPLRQPKLDQVSRMLGIEDLLDRRPTRLSGGQQQKVALARALVRDPELFVFDEPLSSLDAKIRSQARAELRELHDRTGITMLYVTHDQIEALGLADRIAVINQGRLHQVGTPRELYMDPADLFVAGFVGTPPMNLLPIDDDTIAGLRPEHLRLASTASAAGDYALGLEVTVNQLEYLGSEWLAYGTVHSGLPEQGEPQQVIARLPAGTEPPFSTGDRCRFVGTHQDVRWFDRNTGKHKPAAVGGRGMNSSTIAPVEHAREEGLLARLGRALDRPQVLVWLMLGPAVLYIIAFVGFPFILAIALSLSDATIGDPSLDRYVGLANFAAVMRQDAFWIALRNSLLITAASIGLLLVLATAASELLVYSFRGKRLFQVLFILPWAMPVSLAAIAWLWLLDSQFSPVDWVLVQLGLLGPGSPLGPFSHLYYLGRPWLGIASLVVADVWRMLPLATIIVLAARLSIPEERFQQARIDGAGFFRILFRITIPALRPMLIVAILFTSLLIIGEMGMVEILTRGAPGHATQVLPYWAYLKGIQSGSLGQGAAIALFLFPFLLVAAVLALRAAYRSPEA